VGQARHLSFLVGKSGARLAQCAAFERRHSDLLLFVPDSPINLASAAVASVRSLLEEMADFAQSGAREVIPTVTHPAVTDCVKLTAALWTACRAFAKCWSVWPQARRRTPCSRRHP
jgi:hypothetical protein